MSLLLALSREYFCEQESVGVWEDDFVDKTSQENSVAIGVSLA